MSVCKRVTRLGQRAECLWLMSALFLASWHPGSAITLALGGCSSDPKGRRLGEGWEVFPASLDNLLHILQSPLKCHPPLRSPWSTIYALDGCTGTLPWGSHSSVDAPWHCISRGCCHKSPQICWLKTTHSDYLVVLEVRSLTWASRS